MAAKTIKDKEALIVGTILSCNEEIRKFQNLVGLKESQKVNLYHYNMIQLYGEINPLFENNLDVNKIPDESIAFKNLRGNYYAYFQKVNQFLEGYSPNIQQSLNESLNVDVINIQNPTQINIFTFKDELKSIINNINFKDELDKLPKEILKIKTLAKLPILIYGFDICNNVGLRKELEETFNLPINQLISICYDKSKKQLLFVPTTTNIICYDIKEDIFDYYNKVNFGEQIKSDIKLNPKTYLYDLRNLIHNNIIEIHFNVDLLGLQFDNNLFGDEHRIKLNKSIENQKSLIIR